MDSKVLLLKDIAAGRKGQILNVKAGYARNYLIPYGYGVFVDKRTLRLQEKLQQEREAQAIEDRKEALKVAEQLEGKVVTVITKVDPDGNMYGSISAKDIVDLLEEKEHVIIDRRSVRIGQSLKALGNHQIQLVLKEEVKAMFTLRIESDHPIAAKKVEKKEEAKEEVAPPQEESSEG